MHVSSLAEGVTFYDKGVISEVLTIRKNERMKDILTPSKRPKRPIRANKRLHLKCFLVFKNNKSK